MKHASSEFCKKVKKTKSEKYKEMKLTNKKEKAEHKRIKQQNIMQKIKAIYQQKFPDKKEKNKQDIGLIKAKT